MDRIVESLKNKQIVIWEEIARDGAQAKTILNGEQRVEIAKLHESLFGKNGPDHLVFAAGFISIAEEEETAIRQLAEEVDNCYLAVNCRCIKNEIDDSIDAIKSAKFARVAYVLPASERMCQLMLHKSQKEAVQIGVDMAKYALDKSGGIPIDVQFAAAFDADPVFIAETASVLKEQGIATIGLGDTRGAIYPIEVADYIKALLKHSDANTHYGVHFHNDLALALMNNLECIKQGITHIASSWLGLAERNGLVRTELLLFHLAYQIDKIGKRYGFDGETLFKTIPDLKKIQPIASLVSKYTGVDIKVTDPIVGEGVNSISTGTPFVDTKSFQPFDPKEILNVEREILLTQLANVRLVKELGQKMGYHFSDEKIIEILISIKKTAYKLNRSIFPESEVIEIFKKYSEK